MEENISRNATEADLKEAFEAHGAVASVAIIKDKLTGDSRGFGFVEMPNKEEAEKAIAALNGKDLKGRTLILMETCYRLHECSFAVLMASMSAAGIKRRLFLGDMPLRRVSPLIADLG